MTNPPPPSPVVDSRPNAGALPTDTQQRIGANIVYDRFLDCVHCGLCTSACPTYLETGDENDSPRGRIYLMRAVTDGKLQLTDSVRRHLDLCLDCRSCETACPSGVQYGRLIEPFRVSMQQADAKPGQAVFQGWFQRLILYGLFPYPRRLYWALLPARIMQLLKIDRLIDAVGLSRLLPKKLQRMHALLPPLQPRPGALPSVLPAIGEKRARVALFTGCVAEAMFAQTNRATARVLQANGCEVIIPQAQVCCGAIHYHSGAGAPALEFATTNALAFDVGDVDAVIINVAGCGSMLKDYGHMAAELAPSDQSRQQQLSAFADKVRDVSEFLAELGPKRPTGEIPLRVAYHDACHLCHAQQIRSQPRELLQMVPGLELVPLAESDICCGAAGSYNLTEPEMSDRLAKRKLRHILEANVEAVITGNAGCSLQIQAVLRQAGKNIRVFHPMDILDWSYRCLRPPA
jgi:glycolate oxidase iron-sulfur subunit